MDYIKTMDQMSSSAYDNDESFPPANHAIVDRLLVSSFRSLYGIVVSAISAAQRHRVLQWGRL